MKKLILILAVLLMLPVCALAVSFTAEDINGNTVTEAIFSEADLTIVNVWGISCEPCISELPELAAWAAELPENARLIGIVTDVTPQDASGLETARKILERAGVTYTNLLYDESLEPLLSDVIGTPTTLFYDSDGVRVHQSVVGSHMDSCKAAAAEVLGQ